MLWPSGCGTQVGGYLVKISSSTGIMFQCISVRVNEVTQYVLLLVSYSEALFSLDPLHGVERVCAFPSVQTTILKVNIFTHSIHQWSHYAPSLTRSICQPFTSLNRSHTHIHSIHLSTIYDTYRSLTELTKSIHHTQSSNLRKTSHSSAVVVNHRVFFLFFFSSLLSYLEALRQKRDWQMTCRKMSHARPFNRHTKEYTYIIHTACVTHKSIHLHHTHSVLMTHKRIHLHHTHSVRDI